LRRPDRGADFARRRRGRGGPRSRGGRARRRHLLRAGPRRRAAGGRLVPRPPAARAALLPARAPRDLRWGSVPKHQKSVKELVVTQEQYDQGYLERDGVVIRKRAYELIRRLPDGTYLVRAPEAP